MDDSVGRGGRARGGGGRVVDEGVQVEDFGKSDFIVELDAVQRVVVEIEALQVQRQQVGETREFQSFVGVALFVALVAQVLIVSVQRFRADERLQGLVDRSVGRLRTEWSYRQRDICKNIVIPITISSKLLLLVHFLK